MIRIPRAQLKVCAPSSMTGGVCGQTKNWNSCMCSMHANPLNQWFRCQSNGGSRVYEHSAFCCVSPSVVDVCENGWQWGLRTCIRNIFKGMMSVIVPHRRNAAWWCIFVSAKLIVCVERSSSGCWDQIAGVYARRLIVLSSSKRLRHVVDQCVMFAAADPACVFWWAIADHV